MDRAEGACSILRASVWSVKSVVETSLKSLESPSFAGYLLPQGREEGKTSTYASPISGGPVLIRRNGSAHERSAEAGPRQLSAGGGRRGLGSGGDGVALGQSLVVERLELTVSGHTADLLGQLLAAVEFTGGVRRALG